MKSSSSGYVSGSPVATRGQAKFPESFEIFHNVAFNAVLIRDPGSGAANPDCLRLSILKAVQQAGVPEARTSQRKGQTSHDVGHVVLVQ